MDKDVIISKALRLISQNSDPHLIPVLKDIFNWGLESELMDKLRDYVKSCDVISYSEQQEYIDKMDTKTANDANRKRAEASEVYNPILK